MDIEKLGIIIIPICCIILLFSLYIFGKRDGYKQGQIDAINGIIKYELKESKEWREKDDRR